MRAMRAVGVLAAVAVAAVAGFLLLEDRFASEAEGERVLITAPVEQRTLRETLIVRGTAAFEPRGSLLAAAPGRVTGVHVRTGDTLAAGEPTISIDGRPAIAVAGDFPFWRDIALGDEGEDVRQLETILAAEGFDPGAIDTLFDGATEAALLAWQEAHGFPRDGRFLVGDTLVGTWPARVGSVGAGVGSFVTPGMPLLSLTGDTLVVSADLAPTQHLRVREGLAVTVEVTATRAQVSGILGAAVLDDAPPAAGQLPGGASEPVYRAPIALEAPVEAVDGAQVSVTIVLSEVPDAIVVPLAAMVLDGAGNSAVQVRDAAGAIRLTPVTTGLAEGAFIAVTDGLEAGQEVVLEAPP